MRDGLGLVLHALSHAEPCRKAQALIGWLDRDWWRRHAHQWFRGEEMSEPLADDTWHSNCGMLTAPFLQHETFKCKWPPNAGAVKKICAFAHEVPRCVSESVSDSGVTCIKLTSKPRASHKVCPHLLCQVATLLPQDLLKSRCTTSSYRIKCRNTFYKVIINWYFKFFHFYLYRSHDYSIVLFQSIIWSLSCGNTRLPHSVWDVWHTSVVWISKMELSVCISI